MIYRSIGLSAAARKATAPQLRAVAESDPRLAPSGLASAVLGGFLRTNAVLEPVDPNTALLAPAFDGSTPYPTALVEYRFPYQELVLEQPGPACVITHNRVQLFALLSATDPGAAVPSGDYWLHRVTLGDGRQESWLRLGLPPTDGDLITAVFYIVDFAG